MKSGRYRLELALVRERSVRGGAVGGAHYCFVFAVSLHLILACGRGFFGHY
jgi:hypothetical protein